LLPRARALFEKLLWYDQVVFDSSNAYDNWQVGELVNW
jgi:hypothetical protein